MPALQATPQKFLFLHLQNFQLSEYDKCKRLNRESKEEKGKPI